MSYAGARDRFFGKMQKSAVQFTAVTNCIHMTFKLLVAVKMMTEAVTMKMKAAGSLKPSVTIYKSTQCYIPEEHHC
jgi:hypothetical protein